jgi:protein O-GlcNAc transferase
MNSRCHIAWEPQRPAAHHALALEAAGSGRLTEAERRFLRATWLDRQSSDGFFNLGVARLELGRFAAAAAAFRPVLGHAPGDPDTWQGLGVGYAEAGDPERGVVALRRALAIRPTHGESLLKLGGCLVQLGRAAEALPLHRRSLALEPDRWVGHVDLGVTMAKLERNRVTLLCSRRAAAINPGAEQAHINAAVASGLLGDLPAALRQLKIAVEVAPKPSRAYLQLMAMSSYAPAVGEEARWALAREFERRCAPRSIDRPRALAPYPDRRLRIGYLSSDFREHPVARNMLPIFEARDLTNFEVFSYSLTAQCDGFTRRIQGSVDGWHPVAGLSDEAIARRIRDDKIDILVVLAGCFDRNRPLVAAYRAAPIQISMHDIGTSGLAEMDYLVADRALVPPRGLRKERFVERVLRLPSLYVQMKLPDLPVSQSVPQTRRGHVTFGCFNNPLKLDDDLLALWQRLLQMMPSARLYLKYKRCYDDPDLRARIVRSLGVSTDRIAFITGGNALEEHLAFYSDIDVALDSFPFVGSTTTWEALWMGVPVVTRSGINMASRTGLSLLHPLGLHELVANSAEDYLALAQSLADDVPRLARLRAELRTRLRNSPLSDGPRRARQLERMYRAVWRRLCAAGQP